MTRRQPPGIVRHQYKTRGGYKKTLFYPRFTIWKRRPDGKPDRRTFTPGWEKLAEALEELARLKKLNREKFDFDGDRGPAPGATLFPWIDKFLEIKSAKRSARRDRKSAEYLKGFFGDAALAEILPTRMLAYRKHRSVAKGATVNRELAFLRSVLRMAFHDGALAKLPLFPFESEHNERVRTAAPEEYRRIVALLRRRVRAGNGKIVFAPDAADAIEILYEMGFRVGEVLKIQPRDIDTANKALEMRRIRLKSGLRRPLPLTPRAWEILARRAKGKAAATPLFALTSNSLRWSFIRACAMLKIEGLWVHDLRATFATEKERRRWPRNIIMEYTGHRTEYAFRRYSRPTLEDLRAFASGNGMVKSGNPRLNEMRK